MGETSASAPEPQPISAELLARLADNGWIVVPRDCVPEALMHLALTPKRAEAKRRMPRELIVQAAAKAANVSLSMMKSERRPRRLARWRQIAMHYAVKELNFTFDKTGMCFGGRDHSTAMHAFKRVEGFLEDPASASEVRACQGILAAELRSLTTGAGAE